MSNLLVFVCQKGLVYGDIEVVAIFVVFYYLFMLKKHVKYNYICAFLIFRGFL